MISIPEHNWKLWKFEQRYTPNKWWINLADGFLRTNPYRDPVAEAKLREYIEDLEAKLNIKTPAEWRNEKTVNKLSSSDRFRLHTLGGLNTILSVLYPQLHKLPGDSIDSPQAVDATCKFRNADSNFWKSRENRREFLDYVKSSIGGDMDSLYLCNQNLIISAGGAGLLRHYKGRVVHAIMDTYPEHQWQEWKFAIVPKGYWSNLARDLRSTDPDVRQHAMLTIREYVLYLEKKYGIQSLEQWKERIKTGVTTARRRIETLGGLENVLMIAHPEWNLSANPSDNNNMEVVSPDYWKSKENRLNFLEQLKGMLGGTMESFYQVKSIHFHKFGGSKLLKMYNDSPARVIMENYPDYPWKPWCFQRTPTDWWKQLGSQFALQDEKAINTVKQYFKEIEDRLGIVEPEGWLVVSVKQLHSTDIWRIKQLGGLRRILSILYPDLIQHSKGTIQTSRKRQQYAGRAMSSALHILGG